MASLISDSNQKWRVQFTDADGYRKTIRLPKMDRRTADQYCLRIEMLVAAKLSGGAIDDETARWVSERGNVLHGRLAAAGLVTPRNGDRATVGSFVDHYIDSRPDAKPMTIQNLRQVKSWLVKFFGASHDMRTIGPSHADDWRTFMLKSGLGDNTIRRHIGRARQLFKAAIRQGLVRGTNPFEGITATVRADRERMYFVTRTQADAVIDAAPHVEWKLLIALARYGGLRTPSESLSLKWSDIDWERGRINVPSPKTEHHAGKDRRLIPLFPELRDHLLAAFEQAPEGAEFVISRYRDKAANLRTQLARYIRKAGLKVWPKPWHNLRSSRQTKLAEHYPIHVVCAWIGNSRAVAQEYYLQVTDQHFTDACAERPATSSDRAAQNAARQSAELAGTSVQSGSEIPDFPKDSTNCDPLRQPDYPRQESNL